MIISEFLLILVWNNLQRLGVESDMQYEQSHVQNQHGAYTGMAFPHREFTVLTELCYFFRFQDLLAMPI